MGKMSFHEEVRAMVCIEPKALTTTAGVAGKVIDTKGYNGCEFIVSYGAITATDATITVVVKEGDATNALTSVADTYLAGTEALAGIPQATRTDFSTEKVTKRVGYTGNKRYASISIAAATVTAATIVSAVAVLFAPEAAATSNP